LRLIQFAKNAHHGPSCVVWLENGTERLVPIAATDRSPQPPTLYPHPHGPARGVEYSKLALSIAERKQDRNEEICLLGQLASAHQLLGAYEESMNYARRALELAAVYPVDPIVLWLIFRVSAGAANGFSMLFTSAIFQKQAVLLAIDMKRPLQISRSYGSLSETYWKLKNYQEAIALARKALEIGNQVGDSPMGLNIKACGFRRL
jgi:tetratricopeptide (TPR) repeat protein